MGVFNMRCLGLVAMVLMVMGVIVSDKKMLAQGCPGNFAVLVRECAQYVQIPGNWVTPSAACCVAVRSTDPSCAYQSLTPDIQRRISMPKAVNVARTCRKLFARGTRCGSPV
ncbi:hypothetical protein GIB67_029145 [Kingdonia uniflora]|uniref:Bifunctional inhibitor/plant lipid transfer protein/seed storage helical domain-containing protein n=1 Tax=Kingdonia uniflora TaxID=39325 RepID=A0A7J7N3B3_9MAGN|nr:hypothetical protein GIB67_029145 [Kingdonia uniflora]